MLNNKEKNTPCYLLKFFLFIIIISFPVTAYLQGFSLFSSFTSSVSSYQVSVRAVKLDSFGNKYIAGNFDISATIKNTTITGNSKDIFFGKLDPLGNPIWIKTAGGPGSDQAMDLELDNQGGLYISGLFSSTAVFDGDTAVSAFQPFANPINVSDNFLVKYDTSGNFQWIKTGATTDNDFNNNVNGYNNNSFNYYGKSKIKFKNGHVYLMGSNRVSTGSLGNINSIGRQFDGISLPNTQAPGGGGFYGYKYLNSFILKTDVNGTNSWITPIYCNVDQDFDAVIGLDFEVNSNDHVIAQYYYSSLGCKIGGQPSPTSISSFPFSASTPRGAIMILELDGSGFYNNVYKIENALSSFNAFFGFGNALNYLSHGLSIDNSDNIFFVFNNQNNGLFNQTIAGINIPENTNTLVKLNPNFVPTNCNLLNTFPSQSINSFPISTLEIKDNQLIFGGTLDGTIILENNTFSRSDEIIFVNIDTNLNSVNWITSTTNSSVLQIDGSGASTSTPEPYSLGIYDLTIGNENQAVFCGNVGPQYRSFGDYTTPTNQLNDAFITEIIPCNPVYSQVTPPNPVICGAGNAVSLNANTNPGISYQWINNGSLTSIDNNPVYTTNNTGNYSILTDSLGCKDTSNVVNVTIAPLPSVSVPLTPFTVCLSGGAVVVPDGNPSGGVWSGLGMINDSVFDPTFLGPGPSLINYTFTNAFGCSDDAVQIANTVTPPPLFISNSIPSFCENDAPYSLGGFVTPAGGSYTGPGVSGSTFNPSSAGVGTHLITYKYSVAQNCSDSIDFYLVVNANPSINYPFFDSICENNNALPLFSATPFGGTYSGPYVISNTFYPFLSGDGSFPITYSVTENGCSSTSTRVLKVDANENAQLDSISSFCVNDESIPLTIGTPLGGVYKIDGIIKDSLKPAELAVGVHSIEYSFTNSCGISTDVITFEIHDVPSVSLNPIGPYCANDSSFILDIGQPSGGIYQILNDTITSFDPSTYNAGNFELNYIYEDLNGCINETSNAIIVNEFPSVNAGADVSICSGDSLTLNGSGASAYHWDNNVTDGVSFSPLQSGIYQVIGIDDNGCENTDQLEITIFQLPHVNLSPLTPICNVNSNPVQLTGGFPQGGQFTGLAVSNNSFDPAISGSGFFQVDYSYVDSNGCSSTASQMITVDTTNVNIIQLPFSSLCHDDDSLILTGASPVGGTYSGQGVVNGIFYPSLVSPGTIEITYSYLESNSCLATRNEDLVVNSLPTVSLNQIDSLCLNDDPIILNTGIPQGGIYSGVGVANGIFDPSLSNVGSNEIFYSYTDLNGCVNETSVINYVKALPSVNLQTLNSICEDTSSVTLSNGSPVGGIYSGNGVYNGSFFPDSTGSGIFNISYTAELNGCFATDSTYIEVFAIPTLSVSPLPELCVYDTLPLSIVSPIGGVYAGTGVLNNTFSAYDGIIGQNSIVYSYADQNNCTNSIGLSLTVHDIPSLGQSSTSVNTICSNDSSIALQNFIPIGGIYSGTGVNNNIFDPALAAIGWNEISYQFTDSNNCMNIIPDSIFVNPPPYTSIVDFEVCANDSAFTLSSGNPIGGIYSGLGISNGIFDPSFINDSSSLYTYEYSDSNNCTSIDSAFIHINSLPNVQLLLPNDICPNDSVLNLNGGSPFGGTYSGVGVLGNDFDPSLVGTNNAIIEYVYTDSNNCTVSVSNSIFIFPLSTIFISGDTTVCEGSTTTLSASGADYYIWNNTDTSDLITISPTADGNFSLISYDSNGCQYNDSVFVQVNPIPGLTIFGPDTICQDSTAVFQALTSASSFFWNTNDTTPFITVGPYLVDSQIVFSVEITDINGCINNDSTTLHVQNCSHSEIIDEEKGDVLVFPNPNNGEFYVDLVNLTPLNKQVQLIDITGKLVSNQFTSCENCTLRYQNVSSGVYFLLVTSSHFTITEKLIVKQ